MTPTSAQSIVAEMVERLLKPLADECRFVEGVDGDFSRLVPIRYLRLAKRYAEAFLREDGGADVRLVKIRREERPPFQYRDESGEPDVRAATIEECAKVADRFASESMRAAERWKNPEEGSLGMERRDRCMARGLTAFNIAADIRALATTKQQETK